MNLSYSELNERIAVEVFGLKKFFKHLENGQRIGHSKSWLHPDFTEIRGELPRFSLEIEGAIQVLEKMNALGFTGYIESVTGLNKCKLVKAESGESYEAESSILAAAICLAALKAFEKSKREPNDDSE